MKNFAIPLFMTVSALASGPSFGAGDVWAQSTYDAQFVAYPTYDGDDLELTTDGTGTRFRLWSPGAQAARVNLYENGHTGKPYATLDMAPDAANGTWTASVAEKLFGKFYTFQIKWDGKWKDETPGVWAKAVGVLSVIHIYETTRNY